MTTSWPASRAAFSVNPTLPYSGSVKPPWGTIWAQYSRRSPAAPSFWATTAFSAAMRAS